MYSYGSPHTAAQKQDDQHERTFSSYVRIQVVVLKTCRGRWTIGRSGERGSGISVLPARYDDDDDEDPQNYPTLYLLYPSSTREDVIQGKTFKWGQLVWIQSFSFSDNGCLAKAKELSLTNYLNCPNWAHLIFQHFFFLTYQIAEADKNNLND